MRLSPVTTEGEEVEISGVLERDKALSHVAFCRWFPCSGERNRLFLLWRVVALRAPTSQRRDVGTLGCG
jgi:hypothetical protein